MDKKIKAKWVKALRSGEYKQTDSQLDRVDEGGSVSHCCLGVLRRVQGCTTYSSNGMPSLKYRAGLEKDQLDKLIFLNDVKSWSFRKIAYYIDRYY